MEKQFCLRCHGSDFEIFKGDSFMGDIDSNKPSAYHGLEIRAACKNCDIFLFNVFLGTGSQEDLSK